MNLPLLYKIIITNVNQCYNLNQVNIFYKLIIILILEFTKLNVKNLDIILLKKKIYKIMNLFISIDKRLKVNILNKHKAHELLIAKIKFFV